MQIRQSDGPSLWGRRFCGRARSDQLGYEAGSYLYVASNDKATSQIVTTGACIRDQSSQALEGKSAIRTKTQRIAASIGRRAFR